MNIEDLDTSAMIGFVVDVDEKHLEQVRNSIIETIKSIESDDRCYIYSESNTSVPRWPGKAVATIANYKKQKIDLAIATKQTIDLLHKENPDCLKYLFIIFDHNKCDLISKGINFNTKIGAKFEIHLCGIGLEAKEVGHKFNCTYHQLEPISDLSKIIAQGLS